MYMCIFHYFNYYLLDFVIAVYLGFIFGLYFCFVCSLDEVSCTGYYLSLGDAGSCLCVSSHYSVLPKVTTLAV